LGKPAEVHLHQDKVCEVIKIDLVALYLDGFVKSPSAALRFTPALLDQELRIEGIGRDLISKRKIHLGVFLTG
jgi:hypothetical protein